MLKALRGTALVAAAMITLLGPAIAATATGNMTVRITIQAECKIQTSSDLDFGTRGVIDDNSTRPAPSASNAPPDRPTMWA